MPDTFKSVQLKGTKLIIDGQSFGKSDLEALPEPLRPANLATLRSSKVVIFFGRTSPLSNHHHSPMLIDGHHFACVEQFLAWKRATLVGNEPLASKALTSKNPAVGKGILNELHKNNSEISEEQLDVTISTALEAKFSQNPTLSDFLLDTQPCTLGEASLNSKWGIGFKLTDKKAMDPSKWITGGNLLGVKLMELREKIFLKEENCL